ncbi:ras-related protein RABA4d-like, partial [Lingula anatina]
MAARGKRNTGPAAKMKTDVLLKNRTFLIKNLHIDEVLELLYQERKIAKTEYESINEKRTRSKRVKKLLDVLDTKDDTAYDVFRKGLEEGDCDQDFIIRKLDETEQTTISTKLVPKPNKNRYKLVLLGTAGVGKTNLMTVYTGGKFLVGSTATVGTDFVSKNVTVDTGNECEESQVSVQIWDTAGQETYCAMSRMVYREAQGVIFVYDICNRESFEKLDFFLSEFRQYNSRSDRAVMMLVGNKRDLIGKQAYKREVTPEE